MNLNILVKVFNQKRTDCFVDVVMNSFRFAFLEAPYLSVMDAQIDDHFFKQVQIIEGQQNLRFYVQDQQCVRFLLTTDQNVVCFKEIQHKFRKILSVYVCNQFFFVCTDCEIAVFHCQQKDNDYQFEILSVFKLQFQIAKIFNVLKINDEIKFYFQYRNNNFSIESFDVNLQKFIGHEQVFQNDYQLFLETEKGYYCKLYGDDTFYELTKIGKLQQKTNGIKDVVFDPKSNLFFCLQNKRIVVYNDEFNIDLEIFEFEYNFTNISMKDDYLILKNKGFFNNFLLISWDQQNKKLKPLYYGLGLVNLITNQNKLYVEILQKNKLKKLQIFQNKNLVINQKPLLVEPQIKFVIDTLHNFLPLNYFVKKTQYGLTIFFINTKNMQKIQYFQLKVNKNLITNNTAIFSLCINDDKNDIYQVQKMLGVEFDEKQKVQYMLFQSARKDLEQVKNTPKIMCYQLSIYNTQTSQIYEIQMKSPINCYKYEHKNNTFFFGCENILVIYTKQQGSKTFRFDSAIKSIQLRNDFLLIADDKNSAHVYRYVEQKKDIVYVGGDESGRNVIQSDWLSDNDVYTLNKDKSLTIFSTDQKNYFVLSENGEKIIQKTSPLQIIKESFYAHTKYSFRDQPLKFVKLNKFTQKILLDQIQLNKIQFPQMQISGRTWKISKLTRPQTILNKKPTITS